MFDILLDWIGCEYTFYQETEIICSDCQESYLTLDVMADVYRCDKCGSVFHEQDD